ncbi:MAG: hydrolase, partial [Pantoea sp.]|nr:hydrolase [Pantoea sp.]
RGNGAVITITPDRITEYKAPSAEEAKTAKAAAKRPPIVNYPGEGFEHMTKEQWSKKHADFKQVKGIAAGDEHMAYRIRRVMSTGYTLSPVYITDMKTVEVPR